MTCYYVFNICLVMFFRVIFFVLYLKCYVSYSILSVFYIVITICYYVSLLAGFPLKMFLHQLEINMLGSSPSCWTYWLSSNQCSILSVFTLPPHTHVDFPGLFWLCSSQFGCVVSSSAFMQDIINVTGKVQYF